MPTTAIVWLRRDLRLADNPALHLALARGERPVPLYILAPSEEAPWSPGAASRWWLHHSLGSLDGRLRTLGSGMVLARGDSLDSLRAAARAAGAEAVYWNRLYDPSLVARDGRIKQALRSDGLRCESLKAQVLFEPWELATGTREPYRVFTAFWRKAAANLAPEPPLPAPWSLPPLPRGLASLPLDALGLRPRIAWDSGLASTWEPGEPAALAHLDAFAGPTAGRYGLSRDLPGVRGTSQLSPHLHLGEISPRQVLQTLADRVPGGLGGAAEPFVRELGWREFAHHLLYHFPHTPEQPLDSRFGAFPWRTEGAEALLTAWQRGRTGIPLVDAGMRELWHTGWMHNRVRMVVAALLTKHLRLPWQAGARWFWDTLVDADLAANTLGWQWSAGCGADAAPYFRIFNPVRQGERFDPKGDYVRRWCPELSAVPERWVHQPWAAPGSILHAAGIRLGYDYPAPVVALEQARREALEAWGQVQGAR
jgi:deoxyribodipyrimidine photo-lyase